MRTLPLNDTLQKWRHMSKHEALAASPTREVPRCTPKAYPIPELILSNIWLRFKCMVFLQKSTLAPINMEPDRGVQDHVPVKGLGSMLIGARAVAPQSCGSFPFQDAAQLEAKDCPALRNQSRSLARGPTFLPRKRRHSEIRSMDQWGNPINTGIIMN